MTNSSRSNIKAELVGRGIVTLRPSDHIATGGEGSIYRVDKDTVAKIYSDRNRMAQLGLADKILLLSKLNQPYIVAPTGLVMSEKKVPIGYYMPMAEGHPLSRVFTNDFWNRERFSEKHSRMLVARMRDVVSFAHDKQAVMVDANELNWLVAFDNTSVEPRVVDVDSWSIGRWPANVIMPSIRDWHAQYFDERSDWFTWGVVTFQIFTGLHPYKGTHPSYKRNEFIERMKANASVFSPGVRLNQAVRDFNLVPAPLLSWYESVFERGERSIPPSPYDTSIKTPRAAVVMRARVMGHTGTLVMEKLFERIGDTVVRTFHSGAALLTSEILVDVRTNREIATDVSIESVVVKTPGGWLIADARGGTARVRYVNTLDFKPQLLPFSIIAKEILGYGNRLFALGDQGLTEIRAHIFGSKVVASAGQTWSIMLNATETFDGLAVQDATGAMFLALPIGDQGLIQVRVRELDGLRVLTAKAGNRFVSIVGVDRSGIYQRLDLTFAQDYASYRASVVQVDQPELNLSILPKGVNASIEEDGELLITVPTNGAETKILDKHISTNMTLGNFGDQVVYIQNGAVWGLRMK